MSQQQELHRRANVLISELKDIVDELKIVGPCPLDYDNALMNIKEKLIGIVQGRLAGVA